MIKNVCCHVEIKASPVGTITSGVRLFLGKRTFLTNIKAAHVRD